MVFWRWMKRLVLVVAFSACAPYVDAPAPQLSAVVNPLDPQRQPAVLCNQQGDSAAGWSIDLLGAAFAPLAGGVLGGEKKLALPEVTLTGAEVWKVPADRARFYDSGRMIVQIPTRDSASAKQLMAGSYAVSIANPDQRTSTLASSLTVVPPPQIASVKILPGAAEADPVISPGFEQRLVVHGSGFRAEAPPTLVIGSKRIPAGDVTVAADSLTVVVRADTFTAADAGLAAVRVLNPDGCAAPHGMDPTGFGVTQVRIGAAP
jgi:hypothetical protein